MPDVTFGPEDGRRLPCLEGEERTEYVERASGLRLRVTRGGARSWAVSYWSPAAKASRRLKLGDAAKMPLGAARAAARDAIHAVEKQGRDPQAERASQGAREREVRRQRVEARRLETEDRRRRITFGALCRAYIEHRRTTASGRYNRPARPNTLANWDSMMSGHILPELDGRPVERITSEDFVRVMEAAVQRGGPKMGTRVRELMAAVWRWAEHRQQRLAVTLPATSPLAGLPKIGAESGKRKRTLSPAEVWRFWKATEDGGPACTALRLSLLTATRVREATDLDRSELDLDAAVWRLPAERSKGGKERQIPLSRQAVALLREALESSKANIVFGGCSDLSDTMTRLRAAVGGEEWQSRDLRRTAATLCARLGSDPFVVALVLGHARPDDRMPGVTDTYLRWDYQDKVKAALARLGQWIEDTVSRKTEPGDVVAMRGRR